MPGGNPELFGCEESSGGSVAPRGDMPGMQKGPAGRGCQASVSPVSAGSEFPAVLELEAPPAGSLAVPQAPSEAPSAAGPRGDGIAFTAFTARLRPLPEGTASGPGVAAARAPEPQPADPASLARPAGIPAGGTAEGDRRVRAAERDGSGSQARTLPEEKAAPPDFGRRDTSVPLAPAIESGRGFPARDAGGSGARSETAAAALHGSDDPLEPVRTVLPARDIRLQVGAGERTVDVRVSERAGEVQVAVRTADSRLAGTLRDDLPVLAARLEQSGFRAEVGHPPAPVPEPRPRAAESHTADAFPDHAGAGRHGGRDEQQPPPRRGPAADGNGGSDASRKGFSRLFSLFRTSS